MSVGEYAVSILGYAVFALQFRWAIKDQVTGIDGGFEFPRATRPIRYWFFTIIWGLGTVGMPILLVLVLLGY